MLLDISHLRHYSDTDLEIVMFSSITAENIKNALHQKTREELRFNSIQSHL